MKLKIFSIILLVMSLGCGTILNRTSGPLQAEKSGIYGGVKSDLEIIANKDEMGFIAALDVPLSIVADTILLPIDIIISWSRYNFEEKNINACKL